MAIQESPRVLRSAGLLPPGLDPGVAMTIVVRGKCNCARGRAAARESAAKALKYFMRVNLCAGLASGVR